MSKDNKTSNTNKWIYSIIGGIIFLLLSLPCTHSLLQPIASKISTNTSLVTIIMLTFIYILITRLIMW